MRRSILHLIYVTYSCVPTLINEALARTLLPNLFSHPFHLRFVWEERKFLGEDDETVIAIYLLVIKYPNDMNYHVTITVKEEKLITFLFNEKSV